MRRAVSLVAPFVLQVVVGGILIFVGKRHPTYFDNVVEVGLFLTCLVWIGLFVWAVRKWMKAQEEVWDLRLRLAQERFARRPEA
jgi:heme A synthase